MDLTHARERLVEEFTGVFSPETVDECLQEAAVALMNQAPIDTHVCRAARTRAAAGGCADEGSDREGRP
jgi:hypothetical protein